MNELIYKRDAIRLAEQGQIQGFEWQFKKLCTLPSVQPELIEKTSYIRGFEQGKTQGMIDSQGGKKGKWIKNPEYIGDEISGFIDNHFSCSECKKEAEINSWGFYILSDFCPNCGCQMNGGEENE